MEKATLAQIVKELPQMLEDNMVVLVLIDADKYIKTLIDLIALLVGKKNLDCLYISFNQPYKTLVKVFKKRKIDVNKIYFIDLITKMISAKTSETKNCLFIDTGPTGLTQLGIALNEAFKNLDSMNSFVVLDSLSTLIVYNTLASVSFPHFFVNKLRIAGIMGVIMTVESEIDKQTIDKIAAFVDKEIVVVKK